MNESKTNCNRNATITFIVVIAVLPMKKKESVSTNQTFCLPFSIKPVLIELVQSTWYKTMSSQF